VALTVYTIRYISTHTPPARPSALSPVPRPALRPAAGRAGWVEHASQNSFAWTAAGWNGSPEGTNRMPSHIKCSLQMRWKDWKPMYRAFTVCWMHSKGLFVTTWPFLLFYHIISWSKKTFLTLNSGYIVGAGRGAGGIAASSPSEELLVSLLCSPLWRWAFLWKSLSIRFLYWLGW